jgi:hypothetical protein
MPKKQRISRNAKRGVTRQPQNDAVAPSAWPAVAVEEPTPLQAASQTDTRPRRRLAEIQRTREGASLRPLQGQLPTFEHAYLVRELRSIGLISTSLLGVIILLTLLIR